MNICMYVCRWPHAFDSSVQVACEKNEDLNYLFFGECNEIGGIVTGENVSGLNRTMEFLA